MKQIILIIAILFLLAACVEVQPEANVSKQIKANLTTEQVLQEFEAIDKELNTTWLKEQISKNMIRPDALGTWTSRTLALRNVTETNTTAYDLIQARLDMLSAQTAVYLGVEIGENGYAPLEKKDGEFTAGKIDCSKAESIAKATRLYQVAFHNWMTFANHMDNVLLKDKESRSIIGINKERPPFYASNFQDARNKIQATSKAVKEQCSLTIPLEPEPDIPKDPQSGVYQS